MEAKNAQFKFLRKSRSQATYSEAGKSLSLEVEPKINPMGLIVYLTGTTQWDDGSSMSEEELERIKRNIQSLHDPNDWVISMQFDVV